MCYGMWSGANCINGYDPNGNLTFKTDASGATISYHYDALNRLLSKTYPAGTPSSCYQYDQSALQSAGGNLIGRLTNSWTQTGLTCPSGPPATGTLSRHSILAYDAVGRVTNEQQCTVASCGATVYSPSYSYDLAGKMLTHSSGISAGAGSFIFTNGYDTAGNLSAVTSSNTQYPNSLFSASMPLAPPGCGRSSAISAPPGYSAAGALMYATFGSGLAVQRSYDPRLRLNCELDYGNQVTAAPGTATVTINGTDQPH